MRDLRIAAAQFEPRDRDKEYNLGRISDLAVRAVAQEAELVCFHECCVSGYTFLETLTRDEVAALSEPVPEGPSTDALIALAGELGVALGAGLVEREGDELRNTYVVVTGDGMVAKHSKLHPFIHPCLSPGKGFTVFDLFGCRFGILICYDCNLVENVRLTAMEGAEIILAPHVTGCLPSPMPGRGKVDPEGWHTRHRDPVRCRQEFTGPKGRGWLMRWLPARAYENGVYLVYTNPIGVDHDTIKPGGALILDPFGEVLVESVALEDDVVVGLCTPDKREVASGQAYIRSRRPELYGRLVEPNPHRTEGHAEVYWKQLRKP